MKLKWLVIALSALVIGCNSQKAVTETQDSTVSADKIVDEPEEKVLSSGVDVRVGEVVAGVSEYQAALKEQVAFGLDSAWIANDSLFVSVQYGGGCKDHVFKLLSAGMYAESMPPQLTVLLQHESEMDPCRAFVYQTWVYAIKSLRYGNEGDLIIHIQSGNEEPRTTLTYSY